MYFALSRHTTSLLKMMFPLAISMISTFLMITVDRIFLSKYNIELVNAVSSAGNLYWMVVGFFVYIVITAGNFVSEKYGEKNYKDLAKPVWQMIYFSFVSIIIFWLVIQYLIKFFHEINWLSFLQYEFLASNYLYAPFQILVSSLGTFFIGTNRAKVLTFSNIAANLINIFLDYFLIFGVRNFINPMGIKGAALATAIGFMIQSIILFLVFMNKKNRTEYNTSFCKFNFTLFVSIVKRGIPASFALVMDLLGWALFYIIIGKTTKEKAFVASLVQTIFIFFLFFGESLEKSISALSSRSIGEKNFKNIFSLYKSGIKITFFFGFILVILMTVCSKFVLSIFLSKNSSESISLKTLKVAQTAIVLTPIYITMENLRFMVTGILISLKKAKFVFYSVSFFIWFVVVLPTYFFIYKNNFSIIYSLLFFILATLGMFFSMKIKMQSCINNLYGE